MKSTDTLEHPAVWRGKDLAAHPQWWMPFQDATPEAIRDRLENGIGALLIKDFPMHNAARDEVRERFLDWCSRIGTPLSQNGNGDRVFDVTDAGYREDDPRNRGPNTRRALSFHSDRCDVIAFLCWRQAWRGGANDFVSAMQIYNEIARRRPDLLEVLSESFVSKRHTVDPGNPRPWCEQPVFSFQEGHFACSFLRVLIDRADQDPELPDLTAAQKEAMDLLESIAAEPGLACHYRQEPGDLLLLNNWVVLHRRAGFEDHEDPEEKRRLFRVWLSVPNSRPLNPRFAGNFGATEAGRVRGGFRVPPGK